LAGRAQQRREVGLPSRGFLQALEPRSVTAYEQPPPQPFLLDHARERFAELTVARNVETLVREFVEDRADEAPLRPAEHGVEHRVGKPPQRRVGGNTTHGHVVATAL